ncbi:MAG: DUF5301 domain-containing protein [Clostridia bacterium]|nr:DUF5301 domain-containing protein [Clostridia bacterium]
MNRKTVTLAISFVCALLLFALAMAFINSIFPLAEPIETPEEEAILSCTVLRRGADTARPLAEQETILSYIRAARPTRNMSVNDTPSAADYFLISIETAQSTYHYYVYEHNMAVYIECPYSGIYNADPRILSIIKDQLS